MGMFRLPKGIVRSFNSKVTKYWWGNNNGKRGIHWCKWNVLCKNKSLGGLGFRELEAFNQALLAKTVWRIAMEPTSIIYRILQAKYFPSTNCAGATVGVGSSMVWKGLLWGRDLLCSGMRIGDGNGVRVWSDRVGDLLCSGGGLEMVMEFEYGLIGGFQSHGRSKLVHQCSLSRIC